MKIIMEFKSSERKEWCNLKVKTKHDCQKANKPMHSMMHRLADGSYLGVLITDDDQLQRSTSTSSISS